MLVGLVVVMSGGCANDSAPLSALVREQSAPLPKEAEAQPATARMDAAENSLVEEEVVSIPAPQEWPACWLSSRLSSTEAVVKRHAADFTEEAGRQNFRGKSANPITDGDCVISWFGQDNPDEPWVARMEVGVDENYDSVVTCTADTTPDCTCMTILSADPIGDPHDPHDDVPFIVGNCVREADTGRLVIYNVRNPARLGSQPANGACDRSNDNVSRVLAGKRGEVAARQDEDGYVTVSNGDRCRVDVAPFSPRDDEKDWYGDEIRDWAVVTCEDEDTSCRSYILFYKSGEEQGERGAMTEAGLMLICRDGKCQQAYH